MREILFRGAQKVDGVKSLIWYEGSLFIETDSYTEKKEYYIQDENGSYFLVIPETVGQYTGLTDKNGKKIFEGDFLKRRHKELLNHSQLMKVQFVPVKACFAAIDIGGGNITFISDYINNKYELEIVGNIHDNPELLEVTK